MRFFAPGAVLSLSLLCSSTTFADPPATRDEAPASSGARTAAGTVLVGIGGVALAAGTVVLLYGAGLEEPPAASRPHSAGVSTGRGFNAASPPQAEEPEPTNATPYDIGAALLGGGALTLAVGIVVLATGHRTEQRQARVQPARGGVRVSF